MNTLYKTLLALCAGATLALAASPVLARDFVFSVSWQPAFCQTKPGKAECQSQTGDRFDATHFTLHGLWPQESEYCKVPAKQKKLDQQKHWQNLPEVKLTPGVRSELDEKMPGTASYLERHEWTRHGSCSGTTQDAYFGAALAILKDVNASALRTLLSANVGKDVQLSEMQDAVVQDYGGKALDAVEFLCTTVAKKHMLTEIRFNLATKSGLPKGVSAAALANPTRPTPEDQLCDPGKVYVDTVGTQ